MSFGLLFSGQGTQHPQMLQWLHDDALVALTEASLGVQRWRNALQDPAWAARNRNAQILLTGIGLAAWARLSTRLPRPAAVAGYSVGELAAFAAAGVFSAATAIELAAERASAMDRCAEHSPGGLLAVSGLDSAALEALCTEAGVAIAIRIAANAVVLGGPSQALDRAKARAAELGASWTALNVALASHTPAMAPAAEAFADVLSQQALQPPGLALFDNLSAEQVRDAGHAARALSLQIAQTVQWADCLDALHARRLACVLEIGPGAALATMWNKRHPDVPARSADEFRSAETIVRWVSGCCSAWP